MNRYQHDPITHGSPAADNSVPPRRAWEVLRYLLIPLLFRGDPQSGSVRNIFLETQWIIGRKGFIGGALLLAGIVWLHTEYVDEWTGRYIGWTAFAAVLGIAAILLGWVTVRDRTGGVTFLFAAFSSIAFVLSGGIFAITGALSE